MNRYAMLILAGVLLGGTAAAAEAEIMKIAMYDQFLKQTLPAEVRTVFEELKKGSENPLRAFRGGGGNGNGGGNH